MKIYFLSSQPCALTVNDAFFGMTDGFERVATLSLQDNLFIRFTPENALPISFFLNENIRFSPPQGCEVYLLAEGIAIYARDFPPNDFSLKIVCQKRFEKHLITVYSQGNLQLSLETPLGFFVATLPPCFCVCDVTFHKETVFLKSPDMLALFTSSGKRLFLEKVLSYQTTEDGFTALLPLSEALGRVADCAYEIKGDELVRTRFSLRQRNTATGETDAGKIRDELLPFAFFESVLVGADYAEMLCDELAPKASEIRAFLGAFIAVTVTKTPNVCGLVRKKGERLFSVEYYSVELEDGKIKDVKG